MLCRSLIDGIYEIHKHGKCIKINNLLAEFRAVIALIETVAKSAFAVNGLEYFAAIFFVATEFALREEIIARLANAKDDGSQAGLVPLSFLLNNLLKVIKCATSELKKLIYQM